MIGRTISHYKILEEIGAGGMGIVYKAEDTKLKRPVALKFLPLELMLDETARVRLLNEAHAISALQHHNICTVHEIDQSDDGRMFICMDYYEGETLKQRLTHGPLSAEEAIDVVVQVARGLDEAHRRGIVHRDIKPANIIITNQGVVKILDFGLAKLGGQAKLTKTGSTVGTAAYMSPEQVRGEDLDQRSDIFSLGVVFYELLTGASPFAADHEPAVMHKILNVAPPSLRASGVKHAVQLESVVGRMLAKEPELRYASANDVINELKKPLHGAGAAGKNSRSGVGARRIVVAVLVLSGLGASAYFAWKRPWHHPELKQRQLTSNPAWDPANMRVTGDLSVSTGVISPDGRTLAVLDPTGLSLRSIDSGESHPLKLPDGFSNELIPSVDWFPDGSQLIVSGNMPDRTPCVWAIPVLGGRARKMRGDGNGAAISRDGLRIAYVRPGTVGPEIWCADVGGENARRVVASDSTGTITTRAVWSPKGSRLAYARATVEPAGLRVTLECCDLDGHRRNVFSSNSEQAMHPLTFVTWGPDGRLFFGLTDPPPNQRDMNLWSLQVNPSSGAPSGKPRRITQWLRLSAVLPTGVSTDGKRLSVGILGYQSDCYIGRVASGDSTLQGVRRLTLDDRMDLEPMWMPDGRSIVFSSDRNGTSDVFRQALDASAAEPLVAGPGEQSVPRISPDGAWVLYLDYRVAEGGADGVTRLMRLPVTGGPSEKLFDTQAAAQFRCAASPATLCVVSTSEGPATVFTAFDPLHGLGREMARTSVGNLPKPLWDLSPDAMALAIILDGSPPVIRTLSLHDRSIRDVTLDGGLQVMNVAWTAKGTDWLVIGMQEQDKGWNLYHVAASGRTTPLLPRQAWMYSSSPSPDGRHIAFTSNTGEGNVWLLEDF